MSPDRGLPIPRARLPGSAEAFVLSEAEASPTRRLYGKNGALTLLQTAVDLLVLQQLLAVVLKRLISRVRHDEKPSLIGDAGNGHGRLGGERGGARQGKAGLKGLTHGLLHLLPLGPPPYSGSPNSMSQFT